MSIRHLAVVIGNSIERRDKRVGDRTKVEDGLLHRV
jgi:hypothetical protein